MGQVVGDVRSTAEALAGEGEDGGRTELPGGEQDDVTLGRCGCRQEIAMLAWPNGRWVAATTNSELKERTHHVSDGDKVGGGSSGEDFLPYVFALRQQWGGFRNGVRGKA